MRSQVSFLSAIAIEVLIMSAFLWVRQSLRWSIFSFQNEQIMGNEEEVFKLGAKIENHG
jgi:hypothetical protein